MPGGGPPAPHAGFWALAPGRSLANPSSPPCAEAPELSPTPPGQLQPQLPAGSAAVMSDGQVLGKREDRLRSDDGPSAQTQQAQGQQDLAVAMAMLTVMAVGVVLTVRRRQLLEEQRAAPSLTAGAWVHLHGSAWWELRACPLTLLPPPTSPPFPPPQNPTISPAP